MNSYYNPGNIEIYVGPMKSGKTKKLLDRIDKLKYIEGVRYKIFVPALDTRSEGLSSRYGVSEDNVVTIYKADEILSHKDYEVAIIDELQFFDPDIGRVINIMANDNIHVIGGGLNMDFRGLPFKPIKEILPIADKIYNCNGICECIGCNNISTHTQRLINGKPAPFDSPTILVGDEEEGYETRCRGHFSIKKD